MTEKSLIELNRLKKAYEEGLLGLEGKPGELLILREKLEEAKSNFSDLVNKPNAVLYHGAEQSLKKIHQELYCFNDNPAGSRIIVADQLGFVFAFIEMSQKAA